MTRPPNQEYTDSGRCWSNNPEDHIGLLWTVCKDFADRWGYWADELASDAYIALAVCCEKFDPERGNRFSSYACISMERALIRTCTRKKQIDRATYLAEDIAPKTEKPREWLGTRHDEGRDDREDMKHLARVMLDLFQDDELASETMQLVGRCSKKHAGISLGLSRYGIGSRAKSIRDKAPTHIARRVVEASSPSAATKAQATRRASA